MKASYESPRNHKLASEDVRLKLAALARAIILDALQSDGRSFGRARSVNVRRCAGSRAGMKPGVPDLVRNQQRPLRLIAAGLAAEDRKSVVSGKSVSVRVALGGRRTIKNKKTNTKNHQTT